MSPKLFQDEARDPSTGVGQNLPGGGPGRMERGEQRVSILGGNTVWLPWEKEEELVGSNLLMCH